MNEDQTGADTLTYLSDMKFEENIKIKAKMINNQWNYVLLITKIRRETMNYVYEMLKILELDDIRQEEIR